MYEKHCLIKPIKRYIKLMYNLLALEKEFSVYAAKKLILKKNS